MPRLTNIDVVINAAGIIRETRQQTFSALHHDAPIALFKACEQAGVKKIIQISALGADDQAFSQYHLTKKTAYDVLTTLDLNWHIVMPSVVYGPGAKSMTFFKALSALPVVPLVNQGEQQIQPIHINDFTRAIMQLLENDKIKKQRHIMVGPEPISMKHMLQNLRHWLGLKSTLMLPIPYTLSLVFARLGGFLGGTPITHEAVKMLQCGNTASVTPFIKTFGFKPKDFLEVLNTQPALQADTWHAGLFFIKPLLRLSIALLWIMTGLVTAFIYPTTSSYALLSQMAITGVLAPIALYSAAAVNLFLGTATLFNYRLQLVGKLQIVMILVYTLLITIGLQDYWSHPFGPVLKNIPIIVATLIMITLEKPQWNF